MANHQEVRRSLAYRFAYMGGRLVRQGQKHLKLAEQKSFDYVLAAGVPAGKVLVRLAFGIVIFFVLVSFLFLGFWLIVSMLVLLVTSLIMKGNEHRILTEKGQDRGPDYMGAYFYLGNYDDNGHYIGDMKDSDRTK